MNTKNVNAADLAVGDFIARKRFYSGVWSTQTLKVTKIENDVVTAVTRSGQAYEFITSSKVAA
jgi:uncharacterized ubiquitin-like protein YukD